ncbi:MAG: hypothetical protein P4L59_17830 [Desulfosporosinus sp.]|nr:hypothetical protein [Desulfosporosinus sp.]
MFLCLLLIPIISSSTLQQTFTPRDIAVVRGETFYYMAQGLTIVNQDVTDGVIPQKYLYEGGSFVVNPNYVDPNPTS